MFSKCNSDKNHDGGAEPEVCWGRAPFECFWTSISWGARIRNSTQKVMTTFLKRLQWLKILFALGLFCLEYNILTSVKMNLFHLVPPHCRLTSVWFSWASSFYNKYSQTAAQRKSTRTCFQVLMAADKCSWLDECLGQTFSWLKCARQHAPASTEKTQLMSPQSHRRTLVLYLSRQTLLWSFL